MDDLVAEAEVEISSDVPPSKKEYLEALRRGEIEQAAEIYKELNPYRA